MTVEEYRAGIRNKDIDIALLVGEICNKRQGTPLCIKECDKCFLAKFADSVAVAYEHGIDVFNQPKEQTILCDRCVNIYGCRHYDQYGEYIRDFLKDNRNRFKCELFTEKTLSISVPAENKEESEAEE